MTRRPLSKKIKPKVLRAFRKGASESQIKKHVTEWAIYRKTTKEERAMAKAFHDTIIDNIFS